HGERQTAAHRLRDGNHVGMNAGALEAEERAGAPVADLDVVDDQEDIELPAEGVQLLQPFDARHVDAALALHRLDDDGSRDVDAAAAVLEVTAQVLDRVDIRAEIAVVRHEGRI